MLNESFKAPLHKLMTGEVGVRELEPSVFTNVGGN